MDKQNIIWIDYAKFIGIVFVILGHTMSLFGQNADINIINKYINMFHMPLFFIIAGYLYKLKNKKENNIKIIKGLLIPYFIYQLLYLPFVVINNVFFKHENLLLILKKCLIGIFLGANVPEPDLFINVCGPCWFILVIIQLRFIFNNINLSIKNLIFILFSSFILLKLLSIYQFDCYFCIDNFLMALPYFILGYLIKKKRTNLICEIQEIPKVLCILFSLIINFFIMKFNGVVRISDLITSLQPQTSLLLVYIGGISGTFMVCLFSTYLNKLPNFIKTISRNTLFIIFFHYLIIFIERICRIHKVVYLMFNIPEIYITITSIVLLTTLSLILNYITIKILEKYAPFILGKYNAK